VPGVHPAKARSSAWQLRPQVPLPGSVPLLLQLCSQNKSDAVSGFALRMKIRAKGKWKQSPFL
jgi:hypothetical protein